MTLEHEGGVEVSGSDPLLSRFPLALVFFFFFFSFNNPQIHFCVAVLWSFSPRTLCSSPPLREVRRPFTRLLGACLSPVSRPAGPVAAEADEAESSLDRSLPRSLSRWLETPLPAFIPSALSAACDLAVVLVSSGASRLPPLHARAEGAIREGEEKKNTRERKRAQLSRRFSFPSSISTSTSHLGKNNTLYKKTHKKNSKQARRWNACRAC